MSALIARRSILTAPLAAALARAVPAEKHLLYVASPGCRNYTQYGGVGILVFDIDNGYKFVKRIPTWDEVPGKEPENVKGIVASAKTSRVYVSTINRMAGFDAVSGKKIWDKPYEGGCDRMAISPDGKTMYVPQLESSYWHVVDASNGKVITKVETKAGSHNTIWSLNGKYVYMAGLKSKNLLIADPNINQVINQVGPFDNVIRPFTVNGTNTLCFVNINGLLGFEVGDIQTGKKLHHVEVQGYQQGPVKRHGCPSHGIALTPDEKELWLVDGANNSIHVFDATAMPPKQTVSIKLRDFPGWVSFNMDGKYAYSSTGEIIDAKTKKVVATLKDEAGREVESEKMLDLTIANGKVVRAGNQFGVGKIQ